MTLNEINEATTLIQKEAHDEANIIWGMVIDEAMQEEIRVTVIATGFDEVGIRELVKRPVNLKEYMKVVEKPARRKQETFDFKNEALGIDCEDLDKPTFLRRQAD